MTGRAPHGACSGAMRHILALGGVAGPSSRSLESAVNDRREVRIGLMVALGGASMPASAQGVEGAVVAGITFALLLGAIPGIWAGARGHGRSWGHAWLAAVVAIVAVAGVALYTVGGPPEELFTRLVILPLTIVIAIAASAVLLGAPMYAGYVLAYRAAQSIAKKAGGNDGAP